MSIEQSNYSGSSDIVYETVELSDGTTTLRYVMDHVDLVAYDGEELTFSALPMDPDSLADPSRGDSGSQEISISLDNIDGEIAVFAYNLNRNKSIGTVIRRKYYSSDLSTPAASYTMTIKNATYDILSAQITCGYMNILDTAWPRMSYNLIKFPGIRYL